MFKVFGWIAIVLGIILCLTIIMIPAGGTLVLFGGIFLCIHKYLRGREKPQQFDYDGPR